MKAIIAIIVTVASLSAFAHSGGTNSMGCHNDHRTGGYHCH
ncbi:YHYH domain-containing protein [Diaphorobacter sp. ED-3]|nr:YHYH domain-containing protein [Diaphorobacter sp. ED-3]